MQHTSMQPSSSCPNCGAETAIVHGEKLAEALKYTEDF